MKVAELTGALLDRWVAEAEGHKDIRITRWVSCNSGDFCVANGDGVFSPSTDWAQGGPIVERDRIALVPDAEWRAGYDVSAEVEGANYDTGATAFIELRCEHCAASPLVAAMRAYVASKFGGQVPDDAEAPCQQ